MANGYHQLVVFKLDQLRFGLRLEAVERVERAVEVTPLPQAPDNVLGVVNLQGQVVPVFNVRRRFLLPEREVDPRDQFIFVRTERRNVALAVDAVADVIAAGELDVTASKAILPGLECVEGVVKLDDGLVVIHDLDRFLSLEEEVVLEKALRSDD